MTRFIRFYSFLHFSHIDQIKCLHFYTWKCSSVGRLFGNWASRAAGVLANLRMASHEEKTQLSARSIRLRKLSYRGSTASVHGPQPYKEPGILRSGVYEGAGCAKVPDIPTRPTPRPCPRFPDPRVLGVSVVGIHGGVGRGVPPTPPPLTPSPPRGDQTASQDANSDITGIRHRRCAGLAVPVAWPREAVEAPELSARDRAHRQDGHLRALCVSTQAVDPKSQARSRKRPTNRCGDALPSSKLWPPGPWNPC